MNFSSAGYMGGGVALPTVPVRETVHPMPGDATSSIQAAISRVSQMPIAGGFRGAVSLEPGTYECKGTLTINTNGVVLRGSGPETIIKMAGSPHVCVSAYASLSTKETSRRVHIIDPYVPSGATSFRVDDVSFLRFGDSVRISHPVTRNWIHFMGMDGLVRDGQKETWVSESSELYTDRRIAGIEGNRVQLNIPLTDSLDARYLKPSSATVAKSANSGGISQVGIENLRIVSPPQEVDITQRHHQAVRMNGVTDGWLRNLTIDDTVNSISLGSTATRITVEDITFHHTVATKGAAKPMDLSASGAQVLFNRCSGNGDNIFYFVTGPRVTGPIVLLNCTFRGNGHIQPHARWATGLLIDNCQVPESGIDFMNRGEMGSGHGWTIGWAVAWNCTAKSYIIQQPPGCANWAIGCKGDRILSGMPFGHEPKLPEGIYDSPGTPVQPSSLYLAQLRERLGPQAVRNIGY